MLHEKRIGEANKNMRRYLDEDLIKKEQFKKIIYDTYMRNHRESLIVANKLHKENISSLWTVVASYYSMFYIANAILYKLGYKVGTKIAHKVVADALIVFVREKIKKSLIEEYELASNEALALSDTFLDNYEKEIAKRSDFKSETTEEIKAAKATTSLERAEEFSKEIEKLL